MIAPKGANLYCGVFLYQISWRCVSVLVKNIPRVRISANIWATISCRGGFKIIKSFSISVAP
jgi:hypothetical protein